jgi:hypothetical protein
MTSVNWRPVFGFNSTDTPKISEVRKMFLALAMESLEETQRYSPAMQAAEKELRPSTPECCERPMERRGLGDNYTCARCGKKDEW